MEVVPTYLLLDSSSINALTIITLLFDPGLIEVLCDRCSMMQKARESQVLESQVWEYAIVSD
jgi:ABC-type dipeptide/oligopeptide/nickel transport system ATPase subunit